MSSIEPEAQKDINQNLMARVYKLEQELKKSQDNFAHIANTLVSAGNIIDMLVEHIKKLEENK